MAKKKFYAVKKGVQPGIYTTWPEAEAQVKGFSGAVYKGFATKEDAQVWFAGDDPAWPADKPSETDIRQALPKVQPGEVIVYTDGGALNNPGPGGYGVVVVTSSDTRELSGGYKSTTNNRMELMACIVALRELAGDHSKILLHSDSSYVVNGMTKGWVKNWCKNGWRKADGNPVLNQDLWEELLHLSQSLNIGFTWVKGHSGDPLNERCDKLAVQAAKGKNLQIDSGYEAG